MRARLPRPRHDAFPCDFAQVVTNGHRSSACFGRDTPAQLAPGTPYGGRFMRFGPEPAARQAGNGDSERLLQSVKPINADRDPAGARYRPHGPPPGPPSMIPSEPSAALFADLYELMMAQAYWQS